MGLKRNEYALIAENRIAFFLTQVRRETPGCVVQLVDGAGGAASESTTAKRETCCLPIVLLLFCKVARV
jgi:16S rRNA U1498 N3-methylase RsmE